MTVPLSEDPGLVLHEALEALYTISSATHNHDCLRSSPDLLYSFHNFISNCSNLTLQLKSYALMALICHDEVSLRKQEYKPALNCDGQGALQQPLVSYWGLVFTEGRFEMMYAAVRTLLTVSTLTDVCCWPLHNYVVGGMIDCSCVIGGMLDCSWIVSGILCAGAIHWDHGLHSCIDALGQVAKCKSHVACTSSAESVMSA